MRLAVAMVLVSVVLAAGPVQAGIGSCELTGKRAQQSITPARPGRLTVETNLPAPGWWNGDTPDTIQDGFEYCIAANIAYRLGLDRVEVVNVAFDALVAGHTRHYDLALSQVSITEARKKVVSFSVPYFASNVGVLVRRGVPVDAARVKKLRIGVQGATTGAEFVATKLKPLQPALVYSDSGDMFTALLARQIDAAITDTAIVVGQAQASHGLFYVAGQYDTGQSYGAMFPKGSKSAAAIDDVMQALVRDGTVAKLSAKYLAGSSGVEPDKIPVFAY